MAVYNPQRKVSMKGLDYYPTPYAATVSLMEWIEDNIDNTLDEKICLEPAAGGGHMIDVLLSYFGQVIGRDIADPEGRGWGGHDYLKPDPIADDAVYDWVITNPPFKLAEQFVDKMLGQAVDGVAVLARLAFLEGQKRYNTLFKRRPPTDVLVFSERLQMVPGRLPDKTDGASAAAYAWFVWDQANNKKETHIHWLPPGSLMYSDMNI